MTHTKAIETPLVFIGGGNMAGAIIRGGLASGSLDAGRIVVAEPDVTKHAVFAGAGVKAMTGAADALAHAGERAAIVLAVKPQMLDAVASELSGRVGSRLVITILAGTPSQKVRDRLGNACRVVRVMPNLPASIGQGVSAVAAGAGSTQDDERLAVRLFASVGPCVERIEESMMDAFTAIAGSGPAYLFYLAEAMQAAARSYGFGKEAADRIVRGTLAGSASLLAASQSDAAELRAAVTSKGGTTNAATSVLDEAGAQALLIRAMDAARKRGEELSRI